MQDGPNILCAPAMTRIPGFLIFYRSFYLYPTFILTCVCCYLVYKNPRYDISSGLYALKFLTTGMIAYLSYAKKELYFYYNVGLSFRTLTILACCLDLFTFLPAVHLTKIAL